MANTILIFILIERITELFWSQRNTKRLIQNGGKEYFGTHYRWIVAFHALWFLFLFFSVSPIAKINPMILIIFVCLEFCRLWVLLTLGSRWTTKIIKIPKEKPITNGPYQFIRHPNYVVVVGEIFIVPLIFGLWELALLGSLIHAILIVHRIKKENLVWREL